MSKHGNHFKGMVQVLKYFFLVLVIIAIVTALIGVFIYALYRIAVSNKTIYTYLLITILSAVLLFFIFRSMYRKTIITVFQKLGKFFYSILIVGAVITVFLLLGAFVLRYPVIGAVVTPLIIGAVIFVLSKWNPFSLFKNISK